MNGWMGREIQTIKTQIINDNKGGRQLNQNCDRVGGGEGERLAMEGFIGPVK